jgi:HK97 family phage prohead protease
MENKAYHEVRARKTCVLEIKSINADGAFAGYASVFDVVDSQRDVVRPGAFRASLKTRTQPVRLLWQHQWEQPIGVIDALFEDKNGLYMKAHLLLDVAQAREAYALMKAGVVKGLSIGYTVKQAKRDPDTGVRQLLAVEVWEISLVTLPANEAAQVTVVKAVDSDANMAAFAHAFRRAERAYQSMLRGMR